MPPFVRKGSALFYSTYTFLYLYYSIPKGELRFNSVTIEKWDFLISWRFLRMGGVFPLGEGRPAREDPPGGAGARDIRPRAGDGVFRATGAGRGTARLCRAGMHPPFSLFLARRKRENGPCTVQKRKRRFGLQVADSARVYLIPVIWILAEG